MLKHLRDIFHDGWSKGFDRLAHSYLSWGLVGVILLLWLANIWVLVGDYQQSRQRLLDDYQHQQLDAKVEQLNDLFRAIYQHIRTISLIPAIRQVEGDNRYSAQQDVVAEGRLSIDIHETVQQIYSNLYQNVHLSEIYYVLDGFQPDGGEVPFFMYDHEIAAGQVPQLHPDSHGSDTPIEDESAEYHYYLSQLSWFAKHYPQWSDSWRLADIPATISPLIASCDNSQYLSLADGDRRNTLALLYSVPVYGDDDGAFKGIISAVLRANALEAVLLGVPNILVTDSDREQAQRVGWTMPSTAANFVLKHDLHGTEIFDRRNVLFNARTSALDINEGMWRSTELRIVSDGRWLLYHYLSPAQQQQLSAGLTRQLRMDLLARVAALLLLLAIFWRAIRDQRRHHAELVRMAMYDSLTSLPNRKLFVQRLDQSLSRARRGKSRVGLMNLDIDNFSSINETLGQSAGDAVLVGIAKRLRTELRLYDEVTLHYLDVDTATLARLGGDEFTLIIENIDNAEDAMHIGQRLIDAFKLPVEVGGQFADVSLSAGVAIFPDDAEDADALINCADQALRHACDLGRGQFLSFNDEMRLRAARQARLFHDLAAAVREQQFSLHYQPKQRLLNGDIVSLEALLRWQHPELGMISPLEFVPLLEQSGQIVEVGRWILFSACEQLALWQRMGMDDLAISVNVSSRQLLLSDMEDTVREVLQHTQIAPEKLIIELTESMMIDNIEDGGRLLERLRALGVKLAIDDFGTGYSSLTYLQSLPVDYLKIDKSMVDSIGCQKGAHVVHMTIQLAHGLGLVVIAEGIEQESQRQLLLDMGCDIMQGYLLARPYAVEQVTHFLLEFCQPG